MKIDLERIREMEDERARINSVPLAELEIYEHGERIFPSKKILDDWKFTGLTNVTFCEMWPITFDEVGPAAIVAPPAVTEPHPVCNACTVPLTQVRPGKYQCDNLGCATNASTIS